MILSKKFTIRFADFYFDEPVKPVDVDVIRCLYTSKPMPGATSEAVSTILIDLTQSEEELLQNLHKNTRYKVLRAKDRDQVVYKYWRFPDKVVLDVFCEYFDRFAAQKGLPRASRGRLQLLASAGALDVSVMRRSGEDLVWHTHLRTPTVARLLSSASQARSSCDPEYRSLVGRANRYLHWLDMLRFKSESIPVYDFGGYAADTSDLGLIGVNKFKSGFGGCVTENYLSRKAVTWRGKLALKLFNRITTNQRNARPTVKHVQTEMVDC